MPPTPNFFLFLGRTKVTAESFPYVFLPRSTSWIQRPFNQSHRTHTARRRQLRGRSTIVSLLDITVFFCISLISIQSSEYIRSFGSHRFSALGLAMSGFVISDWQGIDRITSSPGVKYSYSVNAGLGAGTDMIMVPYNHTAFIDALTEQVKKMVSPWAELMMQCGGYCVSKS